MKFLMLVKITNKLETELIVVSFQMKRNTNIDPLNTIHDNTLTCLVQ